MVLSDAGIGFFVHSTLVQLQSTVIAFMTIGLLFRLYSTTLCSERGLIGMEPKFMFVRDSSIVCADAENTKISSRVANICFILSVDLII